MIGGVAFAWRGAGEFVVVARVGGGYVTVERSLRRGERGNCEARESSRVRNFDDYGKCFFIGRRCTAIRN